MIQSHITGPEVRVTMTSVNLVANLRKSFTQLRLTPMIVMVVMQQATKWRIEWNRSNLFSIIKAMVDSLNV